MAETGHKKETVHDIYRCNVLILLRHNTAAGSIMAGYSAKMLPAARLWLPQSCRQQHIGRTAVCCDRAIKLWQARLTHKFKAHPNVDWKVKQCFRFGISRILCVNNQPITNNNLINLAGVRYKNCTDITLYEESYTWRDGHTLLLLRSYNFSVIIRNNHLMKVVEKTKSQILVVNRAQCWDNINAVLR